MAASELPVISAVGHQTDFTLCDLVADYSAATPSMAAELAVPDSEGLYDKLTASADRIRSVMQKRLDDQKIYLDDRSNVLELNSPKNRIIRSISLLDTKRERLNFLVNSKYSEARTRLVKNAASLTALNPLAILARGYGFVQNENGRTVSSIKDMSVGERIRITMNDGSAEAQITSLKEGM